MPATITILHNEKEESIQMGVRPEQSLGDILQRCMDYWMLEGSKERYIFLRRNDEIGLDETVISAGIERGDVLTLGKKRELRSAAKEETPSNSEGIGAVTAAEDWLDRNIGLDIDRLEVVTEEEISEGVRLIFQLAGKEEYLTVQVKDGKVMSYIPKNVAMEEE